ncbi:serine protease [Bacteroides sp. 214]|uniref:trypsin-like peptidase domain-containing protein n=1 Tax=Bacteroides sp. 214 TaxID=2302935 RepID=UPI0013D7D971|nr:trypsin-like peptidase domain-containing protein [Bacteroides sp. 214]NDW11365.1 serine protease [Bacteroides sp. 214]
MKKNTLLVLCCFLFTQMAMAQAPKWLEKSKRAVFSIVTYDEGGNILNNGNGFFVADNGTAVSDYTIFKGAARAVVIDSDGKQLNVDAILGANSLYDVVKFRVNTEGKKVAALTETAVPATGEEVYLMAYSTKKEQNFAKGTIEAVTDISDADKYYTLAMKLEEKSVSCPLMTADGKLFGVSQKADGNLAETKCYAVGTSYATALEIVALSANDPVLNSIGIRKGLPVNEEQALVFLIMASSHYNGEKYEALLNDFVMQFPNSADGYIRRAEYYLYNDTVAGIDKANADFAQALAVSTAKEEVHYTTAKTIYSYIINHGADESKNWTADRAFDEIEKAIAINPLPVYLSLQGDIAYMKQDYQSAYNSYIQVTKTEFASQALFFSAAKSKEQLGAEPQEVLALLDSCVARCPKPLMYADAPYVLERARLYMETEQYRKAMLDYDAYYAAANGSVNDYFFYLREQASLGARQYQRALDDIAKCIEMNPNEPLYHLELGLINLRVARYEQSIEALNNGIKLDGSNPDFYRLRGIAQVQLKQKNEACASFAKAKELGSEEVDELIEKNCK